MGAFSLNRKAAVPTPAEPVAKPAEKAAPARTASFSDADMASAWRKCAEHYSAEPVISSTMNSISPERAGEHAFVLRVTSTIQSDILEKELAALQNSLRDILGNDSLTLSVELSREELPASLWTEDKVLESVLERHPRVADFIAKYKLRLM